MSTSHDLAAYGRKLRTAGMAKADRRVDRNLAPAHLARGAVSEVHR